MLRPYRVIVAKPGLDGHDRGARVVARALSDAGFEVVYLGLFQTPASIARAAVEEDAEAVGLSILSGAHGTLFPEVVEALRAAGLGDVLVFGGGVIPADDVVALEAAGIARVFTPGAPLGEISRWLANTLDAREMAGRSP
jgi:methylmalonyl-CoA mutase C-terminal domain/subunit